MTTDLDGLEELVKGISEEQIEKLIETIPPDEAHELLKVLGREESHQAPDSLLEHAQRLDPKYVTRPHLEYLSERISAAVKDVENGKSRKITISMPPRMGKTKTTTTHSAAWILERHPDWSIALMSHDGSLAASWGRTIRRWATDGELPGVSVAKDASSVNAWETSAGGIVISRSFKEPFTGRGAKVLIIDDVHKDFADAHSDKSRQAIWEWYLSVAFSRLEPPSLVISIQTRWHEDDLNGRLLSPEYGPNYREWEEISIPAFSLGKEKDLLGREEGEPLYSPLLEETREEAIERWTNVKQGVGSYIWGAMYQQNPAPPNGAIFNMEWIRFWTTDPNLVTDEERISLVDPAFMRGAQFVDSWDMTFKASATSDYVVGQRWALTGANRYLIAQKRGKWTFSEVLKELRDWTYGPDSSGGPYGRYVHRRLIEESANGAAVIDSLKNEISGIKGIKVKDSKESRARAETPAIESGNVYLPHPAEPGNEWVNDLIGELRAFPHGSHDDMCDAMTQALAEFRHSGGVTISSPTSSGSSSSEDASSRGGRRRFSVGSLAKTAKTAFNTRRGRRKMFR